MPDLLRGPDPSPRQTDPVWGKGRVVMQLRAVTTFLAQTLGFSAISDGLALVETAGYARLLLAGRGDNQLVALDLGVQAPLSSHPGDPVIGAGSGPAIAVQNTATAPRVYAFSAYSDPPRHAALTQAGLPGVSAPVAPNTGAIPGVVAMEVLEFASGDITAIARRGVPGVTLYALGDTGAMTQIGQINDGPKAYLAGISDIASVQMGADRLVLVASALENGISCYRVTASGAVEWIDSLGAQNGLAVNGLAQMQTITMGGQTFAVLASTLTSSLSVVRVNPMGVMFVTDHLVDDRSTRFADVAVIEMFVARGRAFVVAGGTDAGLTVFEFLPGGRLMPFASYPLESGAGMAAVTGIEARVMADKVVVFILDARGDRLQQFELSLATLGTRIDALGGLATGTPLDDRLLGAAGADTLQGGGGSDWLHDGGGQDMLTGGAGADVFVFDRDAAVDRISDFEDGIDRIDVSDWGRIYSRDALVITATATGAEINYGAERLIIASAGGGSLASTSFTDADFVF